MPFSGELVEREEEPVTCRSVIITERTNLTTCSIFCISPTTNGERNSGLVGDVGDRTRGCRGLSADLCNDGKWRKSFSLEQVAG